MRSALRKRSNSRSYASGSTSVIVQRVGDDRAGRRAATRPHRDAVVLGELDEVPDDQEVGVEAHPADDLELRLEPLDRLGRRRIAVAAAQAREGQLAQVLALRPPVRHRVARDQHLAELDLDLAALGHLQRGGHRLRPGGERARHLVVVLQEELVGVEAELRLGQRGLGLHAEQRGVVVVVLAAQVVHVRRAHQRPPHLARDAHDALVGLVLIRDAVRPASRSRRSPGRRCASGRRRATRASAGLSSTRRRQKRDCRQPVRTMTSFE